MTTVYVTHDATFTTLLTKFSPTGEVLREITIGGITVGNLGRLTIDPATGEIWDLLSNGTVLIFNPNTLQQTASFSIKALTIDFSNIWDVESERFGTLGGVIQPQAPTTQYGDIALYRRPNNQLEVFVTGISPGAHAFVLRISVSSDRQQILSAKVIVSSISVVAFPKLPRGIAVNAQGDLLTTLPIQGRVLPADSVADYAFTFGVDFPENQAKKPRVVLGAPIASAGIGSDSAGNFLIATGIIGAPALQCSSGSLLAIDRSFTRHYCRNFAPPLGSSEDVAVSPDNTIGYMTSKATYVVYALQLISFGAPPATSLASVSAASFDSALAPGAIVAAFGSNLATGVQHAAGLPLPTQLLGSSVKVRDVLGTERSAPLFFIQPSQVNYQLPAETAPGLATVTVTSGDGRQAVGQVTVRNVAPGLFSANANGRGIAAAVVQRIKDGTQSFAEVARYDSAQSRFVPVPIDLGLPGEEVFLVLYGTGWRNRSALSAVTAQVGGAPTPTLYAGAAPDFVGLDQLNLGPLPRALAGRGEVEIRLVIDGQAANPVTISVW